MAIPFLSPVDLNRNELQNARIQSLATAPTHAAGLIYFDSVSGLLGVSNGTAWTYLSVVAGLDTEAVQDIVGAMGAGSSVITATYNDPAGTMVYTIATGAVTDAMLAGSINADKITDGTTNKAFLATERTKLSGVSTAATANATDASLRDRTTHTGVQSADTLTSGTTNKLYVAADVTKLAGIAAGATVNSPDATLLGRANHTGTQTADTLTNGTLNKIFLAAEQTKLAGIAAGATANSSDATLLGRANHTGTQTSTTISDFTSAVNALIANTVGAAPAALDTLNELAAALGNDANFAATMTTNLGLKANVSSLAAVATTGTYASLIGKPSYSVAVGDGVATTYVITHSLGSQNVSAMLRLTASPFTQQIVEVRNTSSTTVTLVFGVAPTVGQYTVALTAV